MELITLENRDGALYDKNGTYVASLAIGIHIEPLSLQPDTADIKDIIKLKEAGFDADEIIKLKKEGVI